jgi:hypothetical protein
LETINLIALLVQISSAFHETVLKVFLLSASLLPGMIPIHLCPDPANKELGKAEVIQLKFHLFSDRMTT